MSRYQAWARDPERHRVLVGWDEHRCSFWIQVIDQQVWRRNAELEGAMGCYMPGVPEWHRLVDELEDVVLYCCGAQPYELPTIGALVRALIPYGGLERGQVRFLIHDKQLSLLPVGLWRTLSRAWQRFADWAVWRALP